MDRFLEIQKNLEQVYERITSAAFRVGRKPDEVKLVVVSKGQPLEVIQAAIAAGVKIFGENYPEEAREKIQAVTSVDVAWHMIGHLQSRKTKLVCDHFDWMQSLDSLHLAEKMERLLAEHNRMLPVLLEFNVGGEETKSGWLAGESSKWRSFLPDIRQILELSHLQVHGLMTMPPLTVNREEARIHFKKMVELQKYLRKQFPQANWDELSMGTSSDYEAAVEEGATFVRIGTSILGPRPDKPLSQLTKLRQV
ncbi:MAG: YggS family pyridoxal phosphate-dependent enzyme [Bellilinea sp.]